MAGDDYMPALDASGPDGPPPDPDEERDDIPPGGLVCLRCGKRWERRVAYPLACPRCKSYLWREPYKRPPKPKLGSYAKTVLPCGCELNTLGRTVNWCKEHAEALSGNTKP